jgi:hypothetical protein
MVFFQYLYYRMYKAYEAKNDSPSFSTLMYVSLVRMYVAAVMFTYIRGLLLRFQIMKVLEVGKYVIAASLILIVITTYLLYGRKGFDFYESKFANHIRLNQSIKIWMLIVFPIVLFFGGLYLYVVIFGGQVLGRPVGGLIN